MCGMDMDRAVDHSGALTVIRYSRTRAVYITIISYNIYFHSLNLYRITNINMDMKKVKFA